MSIITISRGSYSKGKEIAEKVSQRLGYECISRDLLLSVSREFNIEELKLVKAIHDAPSFFSRMSIKKERYIAYIQTALLKYLQKDNIVYHGLAGHFFVQHLSHALKVRICADMEDRIKLEMEREGATYEKAAALLKKDDEERRKWSQFLYGIDTNDARLYDLVIHISAITVDHAVDIICNTLNSQAFKTTPESQQYLNDLLKASEIHSRLLDSGFESKVVFREGVASIRVKRHPSLLQEHSVIKDIQDKLGPIEGVKRLNIVTEPMLPHSD